MKFRPCIDLHDGKVKQIVGSTLTGDPSKLVVNFESPLSPGQIASRYRSDHLTGGHIIMLGPGNETAALEALVAWPGGMQIGGGITPDNAHTFLDNGASHVIATSWFFSGPVFDWDKLSVLSRAVGKSRLVVDLSCRRTDSGFVVATNRWQTLTDTFVTPATIGRMAAWCDEFLVHAADVEGKMAGVETDLIDVLAQSAGIPVTYAGGIRSLEDLDLIYRLSGGGLDFTVGSALDLFGGPLSYADVLAWHRAHNVQRHKQT